MTGLGRKSTLVVVGASAGGLNAFRMLISQLECGFSYPIVLVLHIKAGFRFDFGTLFEKSTWLNCVEAEEKILPKSGTIYLAPPGYHLLFERDGSMSLSVEAPVNWARPSIDVAFETAAEAYGPSLIGVLLSGANHDGAQGMKKIQELHGKTLVQDPASAEFSEMPRSALDLMEPDLVSLPSGLGQRLNSM